MATSGATQIIATLVASGTLEATLGTFAFAYFAFAFFVFRLRVFRLHVFRLRVFRLPFAHISPSRVFHLRAYFAFAFA